MRIHQSLLLSLSLSLALAAGSGCSNDTVDSTQTRGLALTVDLSGSSDIGGVHFLVTEAECSPGDTVAGTTWEATTDLENMYLPGGIPAFEDKPYDGDSAHVFADRYFLLPAGCYDVLVTPLDQQGAPSQECYSAHKNDVTVFEGSTTEILLISQCKGPARGGLDVVGTLNNPPQIESVTFAPSKFVTDCEGTEVCVTASDPDNDPLEWTWMQSGGSPLALGAVSTEVNSDGSITKCADINPVVPGTYEFTVEVFDLAYDDSGVLVRIEELLSAQGDPHASRDSIEFPVHSGSDCPVLDADAGNPTDVGSGGGDAGNPTDVGSGSGDAGNPTDVGSGGGDAGNPTDVGSGGGDAGTPTDAGNPTDVGSGGGDAGNPADAGNPSDAGDVPDLGGDEDMRPDLGCTRTQGYYKNHNIYASNPRQQVAWPISEDTILCGQTWLKILGTPTHGNAFYILAHQYIAAKLNIANGASSSAAVDSALAVADSLLPNCSISIADRNHALGAATILDEFNNGNLGPDHCD